MARFRSERRLVFDFSSSGWPLAHASAPNGSIARAIELNLLQADFDYRLDTVLFETVAERVRNARAYYQSVVEKGIEKLRAC